MLNKTYVKRTWAFYSNLTTISRAVSPIVQVMNGFHYRFYTSPFTKIKTAQLIESMRLRGLIEILPEENFIPFELNMKPIHVVQ